MNLLIASSQAAAQALADKAQTWLVANVAGYNAGSWSPLYVSADGAQFGLAWEDRIAPAFTDDELGTHRTDGPNDPAVTFANVQDVTMAQAATDLTEAVAGWSIVPPPTTPQDAGP